MPFSKKPFQRFHELPGNLPRAYYRSWVFANYAYSMSVIFHILFLLIFALAGIKPLALFNILSVSIFAFSIYINLKGYVKTSVALANLEVVLHAWLCTLIIGWNTGFHYYILILPMVLFLTPWPTPSKIIASAFNCLIYGFLSYYYQAVAPLVSVKPELIIMFNYGNIASFGVLLSYFAYFYRNAVIEAEVKLEQEHQKTNAALIERNEILTRLNEELAEAADYVKSMLPEPIVQGPIKTDWRFVPSTSLGGDSFGYHWIDKDHFAIYLLDVSGHGVGAALLSVSVMNTLRSQTLPDTDFKDSRQVLESLNTAFPGEDNNDMFFTIWYGVYKKSTRELNYASGGHPPALLLGEDSTGDSKAALLRTPNRVIGGMAGVVYEKKECQVGQQDRLYIFSDGVYELEKSDGSMWKLKEFTDFMNEAGANGRSVLDRLYRYAGDLRQSDNFEDDFTIVEVAFD